MADTFTTNYNWTKPAVGGDPDTWGGLLNTDLDGIDSTVFAVSGVANGAMPKSGGTFTGSIAGTSATFSGSVTANGGAGALAATSNGTASASVYLQNTVSGGHNWEVASAGGAIGAVGTFYIRDVTSSANRFVIDTNGIATHTTSGQSVTVNVSDTGANGANLKLSGNGSTTPTKTLRSQGGVFQILNDGYTAAILAITDAGALSTTSVSASTISTSADDSTFSSSGPFKFSNAGTVYFHGPGGAGDNILNFAKVGTSNYNFTFFGTASATDFVSTSDRRLKTIKGTFSGGWEELRRIRTYEYDKYDHLADNATAEVGVVAQELADILPTAVKESNEGYLTVSTQQLLTLAINAIQDIGFALERAGIL